MIAMRNTRPQDSITQNTTQNRREHPLQNMLDKLDSPELQAADCGVLGQEEGASGCCADLE